MATAQLVNHAPCPVTIVPSGTVAARGYGRIGGLHVFKGSWSPRSGPCCVGPVAPVAPVAVGIALALGVLVAGPVTGGAVIPVRALGPALVAGQLGLDP